MRRGALAAVARAAAPVAALVGLVWVVEVSAVAEPALQSTLATAPAMPATPARLALARAPGGRGSAAATRAAAGATPENDLQAMLLIMQERHQVEQFAVVECLKRGPDLRAALAAALGRTRDGAGRNVLEELLLDDQPAVRRAAAFALGALGVVPDEEERAALFKAVRDADHETGALAVEALGKLGVAVLEVGEQLLTLDEPERWRRLLPSLYRFKEDAQVPLAEHGLGLADPELHRWSAFALARDPRPAGVPLLRQLVADPDPLIRAWAARGLGRAGKDGEAGDLALLESLLGDHEAGPAIEALRAGAALIGKGAATGALQPGAWRPQLLRLLDDRRAGVRVIAIEAAGRWLPDEGLGAELAALAAGKSASAITATAPGSAAASGGAATSGRPAAPGNPAVPVESAAVERGLALVALARGGDRRAAALVGRAAAASDPAVRARAAEAAGWLGDRAVLERLAKDEAPRVREAALTARLPAAPRPEPASTAQASPTLPAAGRGAAGFSPASEEAAAPLAAAALGDADEGVRTTALGWLKDHPVVAIGPLEAAFTRALRDESIESPLGAIEALVARAEATPLERGAIVALLERLAGQPSRVLRQAGSAALARLGRPAPPASPPPGEGAGALAERLQVYREIILQTRRPRTVEVRTVRGSFRVRLDCPAAPRTCLNLLTLAGQHFYDGLSFHRVVPDFVIQGGDPRGDGFGGPGYLLPDEINPLRYRRGVVGMALAGADTGGSQFFVALSPQPHLDGGYTAFGEVVAGLDVLDAIEAGDRIESIVEIAGAEH